MFGPQVLNQILSGLMVLELDDAQYPKNYRGVSDSISDLYFLGLPWLYTRGSATLGGVKKDANI